MNTIISIDISALFNGDDTSCGAVDKQIYNAILTHGGFVISDFPQAEKIDTLAQKMVTFFDLEEDAKFTAAKVCNNPKAENMYRGYESNLMAGRFAYNEMFDIGPRSPSPAPTPGSQLFAEKNIWPEVEPTEGWRAAMEEYYDILQSTAMAVMHAVGRAANLSAERLESMFRTGNSTLRLINYPIPPEDGLINHRDEDDEGLKISAASHTDGSGLSILWSLQPGLQARSPDGVWRDIPQQPNCLSIHLGDVIDAMTEGQIPATPHRVLGHGVHRQSIGFFLEPRLDVPLRSAKDLAAADDIRSTYGWLLQKRFSTYEAYKGLIESPE